MGGIPTFYYYSTQTMKGSGGIWRLWAVMGDKLSLGVFWSVANTLVKTVGLDCRLRHNIRVYSSEGVDPYHTVGAVWRSLYIQVSR